LTGSLEEDLSDEELAQLIAGVRRIVASTKRAAKN
jgi:hypothetical protein